MTIHRTGTKIKLLAANVEAVINSCRIENENITYNVSYFWNGDFKCTDVYEFEFSVLTGETKQIGFK